MKVKKRIAIILGIIGGIQLLLLGCFAFLHRNVIKALIRGDELPELPEGHPRCCRYCCETEEKQQ